MLKNFWYACHQSSEVTAQPVQLRMLGHEFVLWRDRAGKVVALDDRCPHRGASLSQGTCSGDHIVCPYHGWAFEPGGACVRIPANTGDARVPRKAAVRSYPTEERHGWVWLFVGDLEGAERPPLPPLPEYGDPGWKAIHGQFLWHAHYTRVVENGMDIAHAPFVHSRSFGNPARPEVDDYVIETHPWGASASVALVAPPPAGLWSLVLPKDRPPVKTRVAFYMPCYTRLDLDLGGMKMVIFSTNIPIDDEHTLTRWIMLRDFFKGAWADGNARARTHRIFLEDQPIVESQRPRAVPLDMSLEVHAKSDAIPLVFRKLRRECLLERDWGLRWDDTAEPAAPARLVAIRP
ncbi:aromatic ring-hydroxylating dioxygenase subunit alpha [Nannocystis radixulma]|uniref:Aromatic ring-hydroxylating dioxygenase subunit alpha n=1 Tax=Nannocystis radixulma TaxID=2995305 RepID=A0ABT5B0X9_9BACT|nr:aromatic ring-hydroxylating dioxygenase subunit alpha [Nannocystis radixulma]MDC0666726.1 aromatic ring-hydroxylating dioxygenase subunit alpha [Nannocystis radixulma]